MNVTYLEISPGSWRLRVETGRDPKGKRLFKYETIKGDENDAITRRKQILKADEDGTFVAPEKLTLQAYFKQYKKNQLALEVIGRSTAENYETCFNAYIAPTLGGMKLQKIRATNIQNLYTALLTREGNRPLKGATIRHVHTILRGMFKKALRQHLVPVDPTDAVDAPSRKKKKIGVVGAAGAQVILTAVDGMWLWPIAFLAFVAGLRRGEVLGQRWKDQDLDAGKIRVAGQIVQYKDGTVEWKAPKTEAGERTISIPPQAVEVLRALRIQAMQDRMRLGIRGDFEDAYVFTSDGVNPIKPAKLTDAFSAICDKIGIPEFTFHGTRHTHITALLREHGMASVKSISERAGHSDVKVTLSTYSHVLDGDDEKLGDTIGAFIGGKK